MGGRFVEITSNCETENHWLTSTVPTTVIKDIERQEIMSKPVPVNKLQKNKQQPAKEEQPKTQTQAGTEAAPKVSSANLKGAFF